MKSIIKILTFILLILTVSPGIIFAQGQFDSKKKSETHVNTSSLNAISIDGSTSLFTGSSIYAGANNLTSKASLHTVSSIPSQQSDNEKQKVIYASETGLPIFISTKRDKTHILKTTALEPAVGCYNYLNELKPVLKIDRPEDQFSIKQITTDNLSQSHVRLTQVYNGIPVYGAEVMVHLDPAGRGTLFNGRFQRMKGNYNSIPAINEKTAFEKANLHLNKNNILNKWMSSGILEELTKPEIDLVYYNSSKNQSSPKLTYQVILFDNNSHRWEYFIDAQSGEIIHYVENTCHADGARTANATDRNGVTRTLNTYQKGSAYYLLDISRPMFSSSQSNLIDEPVGAIITLDLNNTYGDNAQFYYLQTNNNSWNNPTAVSAHYNSSVAYEYYRQKHSRNSIDGKGGNIISIINVPNLETGEPLDNASWNGRFMLYGNGNVSFKPLAGGLDVAGHEMTHGVVENTAGLIYEGESGAINESMADIFGAMMDDEDWLIGEDVVLTSVFKSGALRSLSDPHNGASSLGERGYQPNHMSEKYTGEQDNQGVHINSGIANRAFYLYATSIGKEEAAAVYYKALSDYLTKSSQFIDLRIAVMQAATDIYGAGSNQVSQAANAFNAVGITDGQPVVVNSTLPVNPGAEYVLVYNTDPNDANTLYRSDLAQTEIAPLTQTALANRPSITDDGSAAVFVAGDNTLHAISILPNIDVDEFVLQEETIWSNVVVSKDGNRIAAVTTDADGKIYVYDGETEQWASFALYNPTYSEGVNAVSPLYADALEFDYTGEYLVFDAFNSLQSGDGANIEYWDVNFIRVWDKAANTFGDGVIFKLFSSLPENVSMGNPAFSKNSPQIVAFDYIDVGSGTYAILGCNIETGDVGTLTQNNTISWPSFNKDDSRVAFTSLDAEENYLVEYVNLNGDKISSDGVHQPMFTGAAWPVYFAAGVRDISSGNKKIMKEGTSLEITGYPNPFTDKITFRIPAELSHKVTIKILNQVGQVVYHDFIVSPVESIEMDLSKLSSGYYLVKLGNERLSATGKIIKL